MKYLLTLQAFILWFILFFCFRLPLMIIGFIAVPIAYPFRTGEHFPKWAWLWDNKEDGIYGIPYWINVNDGKKNFKTCYGWSALRNPVNNMRFLKLFHVEHDKFSNPKIYGDNVKMHPAVSRDLGRAIWHLTLVKTGLLWKMSFWYIKATSPDKHFRIRFGWKCYPAWILGETEINDINKYSAITFQLMPHRNG